MNTHNHKYKEKIFVDTQPLIQTNYTYLKFPVNVIKWVSLFTYIHLFISLIILIYLFILSFISLIIILSIYWCFFLS